MKKIFAFVLSVALLASASVTAFAAVDQSTMGGNDSMSVTYSVSPTFTVTIPATVELGGEATISAENVVVAKGKQVEVSISDANGFVATTAEGAELTYSVKNGEATVDEGDTVLAVNPKNGKTGSATLSFTAPETVQYAGTYTGTVIFTVSVNDAPVEIINFTIDTSWVESFVPGLTSNLQAEEGMTWGEWLESEYNVDGYVINYSWWYETVGIAGRDFGVCDPTVSDWGELVHLTDKIIADYPYSFTITGG